MATFTQSSRQMGIETPLGADVLLLKAMSGAERLGRLPVYELELMSSRNDIAFSDIVGQKVTVWLTLPRGGKRYFNGYVSRFQHAPSDADGVAYYQAEMVPWLWLLTRTSDCRIFQQKKVPDIIKEVFRDRGFSDFEEQLTGTYREWDYCVQYRETDYNFVCRLMEQEGIYYYFKYDENQHTLVLADSISAHDTVPDYEEVPYRTESTARVGLEYISKWSVEQRIQSGKYTLTDYCFELPSNDLTSSLQMAADHAEADYEVYDFPGEYSTNDDGETYVRVRMEEQQAEQEMVEATMNARGLFAGCLFSLIDFAREDQNREYLVVGASYDLHQSQYSSGDEGTEARFSCSIRGIESRRPYRVARLTPKPVIQGPQTAFVVGPDGEEIHTDEYGRVKVQFHWDRLGHHDANSSCWIRVSQTLAGRGWGAIHLPRIGQEVIVQFMEGDPDQPIVVGRVYNGENNPPYTLPDFKTQSGIKTRSTKEGSADNFNEIRIEDMKGSEHILIHAEKDKLLEVENDQSISVGHDRTESTGHDRTLTVANDKSETVGNDKKITVSGKHTEQITKDMKLVASQKRDMQVGADLTEDVGGKMVLSVGKDRETNVTDNLKISVGKDQTITVSGDAGLSVTKNYTISAKKIQITAQDELSIKVGSASLTLKKSGDITLKGGKINVKGSGDVTIKGSKIAGN